MNRAKGANNTSGICGVTWNKKAEKWQAQITVAGRGIYLGVYDELQSAGKARKQAEAKYGFHVNHGL